jgi:hypothetical protein
LSNLGFIWHILQLGLVQPLQNNSKTKKKDNKRNVKKTHPIGSKNQEIKQRITDHSNWGGGGRSVISSQWDCWN